MKKKKTKTYADKRVPSVTFFLAKTLLERRGPWSAPAARAHALGLQLPTGLFDEDNRCTKVSQGNLQ